MVRACTPLLLLALTACGLADPPLPPQRPAGEVSGSLWLDGPVAGARVRVRGADGALLGTAVSDADGAFRLVLHRADGPLTVSAAGGADAAGPLPPGLRLLADGHYREGMGARLHPGPFTTLNHRLAAPAFPVAAATDPRGEAPESLARRRLLAALTALAGDLARRGGDPQGQRLTAAGLLALMSEDAGDGLLDGCAGERPLAFGETRLAVETYRLRLGEALLTAAQAAGEDPVPLRPQALALVRAAGPWFPAPPADPAPPVPLWPDPPARLAGTQRLQFTVSGPLRPWRATATLDGRPVALQVVDTDLALDLDSTPLADGVHRLELGVEDLFGHSGTGAWELVVDNTRPWLRLDGTGPFAASPATLSGTAGDDGGAVRLTVAGEAVTVGVDGRWQVPVALVPGEQVLALVVTDEAGNREETTLTVSLDPDPPEIHAGPHGQGRFQAGGVLLTAPLADHNDQAPLRVADDALALAGTPWTRAALDAAAVPYFAFVVSDAHAVTVELRYLQDETVVSDWRPLAPQDDGYLVPLAAEVLGPDWARTGPLVSHRLQVRARDAAGNVAESEFTFRVDLHAAPVPLTWSDDPLAGTLAATPFPSRAGLLGVPLAAVRFRVDNRDGPARLLRLEEAGGGSLTRLYTEKRRRHLAVPVTTHEWRVGWMDLIQSGCPGETPPAWETVDGLWNYTGPGTTLDDWTWITPPAPEEGAPVSLESDAPPPPAPGPWRDAADPDPRLIDFQRQAAFLITASFDYVADLLDPARFDRPAWIRDWHYEIPGDPGSARDCPEARFFQAREVQTWRSLEGYPRDEVVARADDHPLEVADWEVSDGEDGTPVAPLESALGPVYPLPAGGSLWLTVRLQAPALAPYEDAGAVDPAVPGDYQNPARYDQALVWRLRRRLAAALLPRVPLERLDQLAATPVTADEGDGEHILPR